MMDPTDPAQDAQLECRALQVATKTVFTVLQLAVLRLVSVWDMNAQRTSHSIWEDLHVEETQKIMVIFVAALKPDR